ncbi:cupin domain-containing protein [Mycobacterium interjectum]|uniref:cupin domain-containing protein n=1 Tax=Mycobacterium interjectum TaxID=33895 RepID=UPI00082ED55B|nr:cupin domain-containing protein [Mycobacterium interjectum]MCV7093102.1 cupin [Mycobacterium interjectum]
MSRTSLAWLLQPLTVQTFLEEVWGVTHYQVKRSRCGYFDGLVHGPTAFDELLERVRPEPSAVRLVRGGESEAADAYRCPDGSLDLTRVREAFAEGYTIVLNGLEQYVRAIASLSHSIEVELNFPTRVNAYFTPPESTGFEPHYDPHDVLILQIHGFKVWRLSDGAAVPPHEIQRRQGVAGDIPLPSELRLETGDVLYLPRGQVHAAETASEPSVHLTVGIHAPTVLTLITHALHSLSLRDDRLHARLPPRHIDDNAVRARLGGLVRDIVEDPGVVAGGFDAMEDVLVRRGRCPPVGRISDSVAIDGDTVVAKHQPLYSRVVAAGSGAALQFAQLSISVGADHTAAMLFVSKSTEPFRVRDLPRLTAGQQTELTRTLIAAGFLVRLPPD